jgi:predicted small metal-binding protein
MNVLHCRDMGFAGDGVIGAHNEEEVPPLAAEHAQIQHGVHVTPQGAAQVRSPIRDEDRQQARSPTLLPPGIWQGERPCGFWLGTL